ncbi:hypothetical protein B0H14DRAFT_2603298 [Mycena olivaceomarginata]|nr:hypothetical protein B0H14DRAFT_2603298 [Mycena olivaceomarginata]
MKPFLLEIGIRRGLEETQGRRLTRTGFFRTFSRARASVFFSPNSHLVSQKHRPRGDLPEEFNLNGERTEILEHCSPFDLAQLAMTSKSLRSLIRGHRHLWIAAQGNVSREACLGVPTLSTRSSTLPAKMQISPHVIIREASLYADSAKKYDNHLLGRTGTTLSFALGEISSTQNGKSNRPFESSAGNSQRDPIGIPARTVVQLRQEYLKRQNSRSALLQNAKDLEVWRKQYIEQKDIVRGKNFELDLALVTHTVWIHNRTSVLKELKSMADGVFPEQMVGRGDDKLRCLYCRRLITVKEMADHIVDKHEDQNPDSIPFIPETNEKHCPDCPDSKRVFTKRGLQDHKIAIHSKPSHSQVTTQS